METYNGHVRTPGDAIILFEACRIGLLPRVQRRLSEKERQSIKSGSVFVWDEREAGMRRWTDGKSWSASRVSGSFLTYREMEGKRGGNAFDKTANRDGMQTSADGNESDGGPDGYRYKPDGLMKQSFSITTNGGQHLHLISYYSRSSQASNALMQPTADPQLRHIRPEKGMYPESTVHEQSTIPAVTRGPMSSPGYAPAPHQSPYPRAPYGYGPPHGAWAPPSPMHTPPPHPHYGGYYGHPGYGQPYIPHQPYYGPPQTAYDRPPPHLTNPALPPPPAHHYGYPPQGYPGYPPQPAPPAHYQPPPIQQAQPPPAAPVQAATQTAPPESNALPPPVTLPAPNTVDKETQQDSTDATATSPTAATSSESQAQAGAEPSKPAATTGQTIPSIHTMLSGGENGQPPVRASSRSPNGTMRVPSDIPSHKLGFEANRDMQALRNLDKTTFKAY
nr:hypothetical protein B0A51_18479 [Rachicladosporium sp. CCFEE 5018]